MKSVVTNQEYYWAETPPGSAPFIKILVGSKKTDS